MVAVIMKKCILALVMAMALITVGCGKEKIDHVLPSTKKTETIRQTEAETEPAETSVKETESETVVQSETTNQLSKEDLSSYIRSIEEQSDAIKYYLENEAMSQYDLNVKSQELYELWDGALNYLWGEIRNVLPAADFEKLLDEQLTWIADKEKAVEEAGKEVEGGSMYPLVVNGEAAAITEERVYDFVELLNNR